MLALFAARMETPTARLITAVCIIAVGTAIASYGEVNLNVLGIIFMFSSESFEAIRLVMSQMLLVGLKMHPGVAETFLLERQLAQLLLLMSLDQAAGHLHQLLQGMKWQKDQRLSSPPVMGNISTP